jgi:tRNA(Leu) C34 or U34 (ribose-2'-O)-methylase TrmL
MLYDKDIYNEEFEPGKVHVLKKDGVVFTKEDTPAIALYNPKYPHNVGSCVRALSCFGGRTLIFSGKRIPIEGTKKDVRLPREERMKGYYDVTMLNDDYFFNRFNKDITPVAVEVRDNSESLVNFQHPENPLYVFGPEDGSLERVVLQHCKRFVVIPSKHCLNLAAAVNIILYDRLLKKGVTRREDISC